MKTLFSTGILAIALSLLVLCCRENGVGVKPPPGRSPISAAAKEVVGSSNQFGFRLFAAVNRAEGDKNIFISPLSVSMAFGMLLNGASGATLDSLSRALGFGELADSQINVSYRDLITLLTGLDPTVTFQIANSIWYKEGFSVESPFIATNRAYFNAFVEPLDFSDPNAASTINLWVKENTHGRISGIVDPPIPTDARMFLINAIYFKGSWRFRFDSTETAEHLFTLPDGTKRPVPMMKQSTKYLYYENQRLQMVDLPYGAGDFRMTVVLPAPGWDINEIIAGTDDRQWAGWITALDSAEGELTLPKFKLQYGLMMNDVLKSLGMSVAFDPDRADFTRINKLGGLYISYVKHKSFVEVNESGTEAAAVTSIGIYATGVGPRPEWFVMEVTRPFLFVIRDAPSGTVLFIGKIVEPGATVAE